MATLPATIPGGVLQLQDSGRSVDLDGGVAVFGFGWMLGGPWAAARALAVGVPTPGLQLGGVAMRQFGELLFERILVIPRRMDAGFVLADKTWQVEVWNSHRAEMLALTAVQVTGVGGITAQGPSVMTYYPGQSQSYTMLVPGPGDPVIDSVVVWTFPGESGADHVVTGQRTVLWAFEPDWSEIPSERLEWKTNVLRAYTGQEQRIQLRGKPRRYVTYTYTFEDAQRGARAQSLIWGWQARVFGVPIWQDAQQLVAELPVGSSVVAVDTTLRDFEASGQIVIWSSHLDWEVVQVATFSASQLVLARPTLKPWPQGSRIVPLRMGTLPQSLQYGRDTTRLSQARAEWFLDARTGLGANRVAPDTFPVYQGYPVLTEEPDWGLTLGEQVDRDMEPVDAEVGPASMDAHTTAPEFSRPFNWLIHGRVAISQFLGFLEARKGRCVPFWLPTYAEDLEQVADASAGDTVLSIKDIHYSRYYAQHANRRDVAFYPATGEAPVLRRIMSSAPGAAGLESITLDQSFGVARRADQWRCISFLAFVRLDQDSIQVDWETDELLRVSFRVKEILL